MNLGTMYATLGVDTKGLVAANAAMSNFQKNTITKLSTLSQKFRTFGYLAGAAITLPIVAAGKASFNAAKDYEYSMQKIVGLTGVAQGAVDKWSSSLLELSPMLAKGPQELGEALYFVSSSGIQGAQAMKVVEISAKAAASGLGKTQDVADVLTSALNAYAGTSLTAAKATDIMITAVRVGKIEADQFAQAVGQVIPIASAMGVTLDQVAGGMAAMSLTGSSASQAATYLKGILNGLWKESTKGADALEGMNSSYAELRQILGNQGLVPLLQKIRDMSLEYGDTLASKIFPNIRALTGYLSIAGKNFKYNTEIMKEVTNSAGALNMAWAAVANTIKIKLDRAIASIQVSMIKLGKTVATTIIPLISKLAKIVENIATNFDTLTEEQKKNKIMWAVWIAAAGPAALLLSLIGYTITGLLSILVGLGKSLIYTTHLIRGMTGSFAGLRAAMVMNKTLTIGLSKSLKFLLNPWVAAAAAVVALTIGIIKYSKKVKEMAKEHDLFYTSVVKVNGELRKLKDLTRAEMTTMTSSAINAAQIMTQQALVAANERWEQFEKNKSLKMINQRANLKLQQEEYQKILQLRQVYDDLGDVYYEIWHNNLIEQQTIKTEKLIAATKKLKDELAAINRWYLEQYQKRITPKAAAPTFDAPIDYQKFFMMTSNFTAGLPVMKDHLKEVQGAAVEMGRIFTNVFMSIGEGFQTMTDIIIHSLKRLAAQVAASAIIFGLLKILSLATGGIGTAAAESIEGGFWKFLFKPLGRGVNMAGGGVVPGGYPNDTYPAMLTSGERVTPPGKLDNVRAGNAMKIIIEGKLKGKDIYWGVVRYAEELETNT